MEIRWIEAIDCHSHFDHGTVHDRKENILFRNALRLFPKLAEDNGAT